MEIQKFPLLNYLNSLFPDVNLNEYHLICVQHIVASTISLFRALIENGLNPKNLSAIGKCYSTRPEALEYLLRLKIDVAYESLYFNPCNSFDNEFKQILLEFFEKRISYLEKKRCKKLIILDDGGELLSLMNSLLQKNNFWLKRVIGIEQTTAGYSKLKLEQLLFPVINIARSDIKLFHESPFIARVAVKRLIAHLNKLSLFPKNALVIGNGAVGSHVHHEIKNQFKTETFDIDFSKSSLPRSLSPDILNNFDMIIGCTGKTVIHPYQFQFLKKDACLVSVSSSDRELSGFDFRKKVTNITSCHQDIYADGTFLLNCGFPINFDDAYEEIDTPEFQLTRAILLGGIYQSITQEHVAGLVSLDKNLQEKIFQVYDQIFLNLREFK